MGLLSDPSLTPRHKFGKILTKYHSKLGWLLYVASIVWFGCLGHKDFNHGTYLSENALSPGLVYPEIKQDSSRWAQQLVDELKAERENYKMSTPHAWISAKMKQIGLETYVHNYTLRYPFAGGKEFHGKNIYGILRAPRTSSTEGLIFSAPYRAPTSYHTDITASVPVLLAFAEFARKKNYWAKDIIFLVTEQEQLGMHAFLEAYFNTEMDEEETKKSFLNYGHLPARAGSLQAALNIEIQDLDIGWLLYVASIVWFGCLGHKDFNHGTYLSENALSPGLVYPEIKQDSSRWAQQLVDELKAERENYKMSTPHAWISAKMKQIGLETYVHNYTLRYPFAGGKEFHGKNIYGILRAPRTSSTEGLIFSAPYRAPTSYHTDITASVPVLLAFAEFARKKNYWAKDIIFLVTEQEQLGMHAFLEAYFNTEMDEEETKKSFLNYGHLPARAGSLQAALNIEIQDLDIDYIDVKIEGLNGQLPNLDMFNLVQRITAREGIISGYRQTPQKKRRSSQHTSVESNIKNLLSMLLSQTTGVPNGNHGLFHRHRIESLTLEAVKRPTTGSNRYNGGLPLLKTIEGISRSLNNLLERFHQSYFFYILAQNDRFVSIGDYMPCLALLVVPLFIKSFLMWLIAGGHVNDDAKEDEEDEIKVTEEQSEAYVVPAILFVIYACAIGYMCQQLLCLELVVNTLSSYGLTTAQSVTISMIVWVVLAFVLPLIYRLPVTAMHWLHLGSLVGLGTALVVVGLLNFALAFLIALICVPLAIGVKPNMQKGFRKTLLTLYCILLNPLVFIYGLVCVLTLFQFPELNLKEVALRAVTATMDAITFSLTDNLIYNNWLCTIVTLILLPLWCCFWTLVLNKTSTNEQAIKNNKKLD